MRSGRFWTWAGSRSTERTFEADRWAARPFLVELDPADDGVIGCVYLYPSPSPEHDVVQFWVRVDRAALDGVLADAVAEWVARAWPWERVDRCGR